MSLSSKIFRGFISSLLILALTVLAFADTIHLKDGSIIKGRIVGFGNGKFTVAIGDGARRREMTFLASEVESILFDSPTDSPMPTVVTNRTASYQEPPKDSTQSVPPRVVITDNTSQVRVPEIKTSTPKTQPSKPADVRTPEPKITEPKTTNTPPPDAKMNPIGWQVKVLADNTNNGWTNSGFVVKKGQRVHITGDGQIQLGKGHISTPSGVSEINDDQKLLKGVPTGALIAVIGDDNNDFIYVGAEREFTATRDGALFLGVNESYLDDNSGAYAVKVEITPGPGK